MTDRDPRRLAVAGALFLAAVACASSSCGDGESAAAPRASEGAGELGLKPLHAVELFCNNHRYGPTHGLRGGLGRKGQLVNGPQGAASEIRYELVDQRDGADVYELERRFPIDSPTASVTQKRVEYRGEELVVFEDEFQRVVLRPPEDG